jgi:glycosyltransferase involved in cell wall biosynthesis
MDKLADLLTPWAVVHREPYTNTYDRRLRVIGAVVDRALIRRLTARFRAIRPDVIHVNKQNVEDGLDLVLAAAKSKLPFLTTIHITRPPDSLGALGGAFRARIARYVLNRTSAQCLAIAGSCAKELAEWLRRANARSRIHCVLNGVGNAPPANRAAIRSKWNCRQGDVILGCLARIEDQKNPLFMVGLLPQLPAHVRLVWIGDGRLRSSLLDMADQLEVRNRVHVEGWRPDGRALLAGFDVFVLPSKYEGFPFALLEAMAAGLPCVASDVDGTREAIIDRESGMLCPPSERESWVARLNCLIEDESLRRLLGDAARRRYASHLSLDAMSRGTEKVYQSVITDMVL